MDAHQEEFLSKLYERTYKKLILGAYAKLHDYHRAEEIVMDVFLNAILKYDEVSASPNPDGWMMRTLQFKLLHELRDMASHPDMVPLEYANFLGTEDDDLTTETRLSGLPPKDARLAKLVWLEGYTSREAAEILHMKPAACRKRLERIRNKLRNIYGKDKI